MEAGARVDGRMRLVPALLLLALGGPALAHHPAPSTPRRLARTQLRLELGVTRFHLEGHEGWYETLAASASWRLPVPVAVGARVPFHLLHEGGDLSAGIGDLALVATAELVQRSSFALGLTLAAELPTGDEERGIGGGHAELSAGLAAEARRGSLRLGGQAAYVHSLGSHDEAGAHRHTFVDPHDARQLELAATVLHDPGAWRAGLGLGAELPLAGEADVRLVATARAGLGGGALRWSLVASAALNDERPYDARLVLGAAWEIE